MSKKKPTEEPKPRRGVAWERTEYPYPNRINLEKIFQDEWNKENTPQSGLNRGLGTAQELFVVPQKYSDSFDGPYKDDFNLFTHFFEKEVMVYELTEREQRIILTVMQWLGTNCGFAFLCETLRKGGYSVNSSEWIKKFEPALEKGGSRFTLAKNRWSSMFQNKIHELMKKGMMQRTKNIEGPEKMTCRERLKSKPRS